MASMVVNNIYVNKIETTRTISKCMMYPITSGIVLTIVTKRPGGRD